MADREMGIVGSEDGVAIIQCRRKGCLTPEGFWLNIELPYDANPTQVWDIWYDHRIAHANLEK